MQRFTCRLHKCFGGKYGIRNVVLISRLSVNVCYFVIFSLYESNEKSRYLFIKEFCCALCVISRGRADIKVRPFILRYFFVRTKEILKNIRT